MNDKDWTVQKRLLSARRASQMAVFDNEIERWGEVDVPYLHLSSSEVINLLTLEQETLDTKPMILDKKIFQRSHGMQGRYSHYLVLSLFLREFCVRVIRIK
ncbi:hypothetical protein J6590_084046 [Homalodisca vitripennis]|nr:hypothetical protein J6590_084046 [Homalodisca vitripennis]